MKCLTAPHEAGLSPHVLLRLVPGSLAALLFIALTPCCLPTTTYPDCRLYTSGSCTPGLSHTALSPFSTRTRTTIIPCSHKKRSSSHSNGWYAHHAMLTIAPATLPAQRKPHTAPSTRLPQYSLDEEVRIVCYSPPLPKKRRGMCVVGRSRAMRRDAPPCPPRRVVPPPPPVQMRKVVTLTSSPGSAPSTCCTP